MPKLIAHRGLTEGPNKALENNPDTIRKALDQGFDCEIDLWKAGETLYLGHDGLQYVIDASFLEQPGLWIHAKNLEALRWLTDTTLTYFWHQSDDCVLTSSQHIWTQPGKPLTDKSICVMPEWNDPSLENINFSCYGICSDYVLIIRSKETIVN